MKNSADKDIPLGKPVSHFGQYHPEHLFPVPRIEARKELGIGAKAPFTGVDLWNAYEISWLDSRGKPRVAMGKICFPASTENIIESKSLKLYLNSFNQTRFRSAEAVASAMEKDLSRTAKGRVSVSLIFPDRFHLSEFTEPGGICVDEQDIEIDQYRVDPSFLRSGGERVEERLFSDLLRTNCPVTGQPDWATVIIDYAGPKIDREGLLRYIVSYREHTGFHENCVERMFVDISGRCSPEKLSVYARFTRRGGIDINPFRSSFDATPDPRRLARQ